MSTSKSELFDPSFLNFKEKNAWNLIILELRILLEEHDIYLGISKTNGDFKYLDPILKPVSSLLSEVIRNTSGRLTPGTCLIKVSPRIKKYVLFKSSSDLIYVLCTPNSNISNLINITTRINRYRKLVLELIEHIQEIVSLIKPKRPYLLKRFTFFADKKELLMKKIDDICSLLVSNLKINGLKKVAKLIKKLHSIAKKNKAHLIQFILKTLDQNIQSKMVYIVNSYINDEIFNHQLKFNKRSFCKTNKNYNCDNCDAGYEMLVFADDLYFCKKCNHVAMIL